MDTYNNRPSPGIKGRRFRTSDGAVTFVDDGTLWRSDIGRGALGYEPPPTSDFGTIGGTTTGQAFSKSNGMLIFEGASTSGAAYYQYDAATLGTTFQVDVGYMWAPNNGVNGSLFGLILRNTSDTKLYRFSFYRFDQAYNNWLAAQVQYFTGTTPGTVKLTSNQTFQLCPPGPMWLRLVQDATNITYYVSADGQYYRQLYQEARNLHTTPNRAGFWFESTGFASVFSFKVT